MTILFTHNTPSAYPDNFHVINDVMRANRLFRTNRGCEVGVRNGFFSRHLMEHNQWLSMWCVDPYTPYQDVIDYQDEESQAAARANAFLTLECFGARTHWMYTDSVDAARQIPRNWFDFVFIDANHEYKYVKQDIEVWAPCIRHGGLLCGHDWTMAGVNKAVKEFAGKEAYEIKSVLGTADVWLIESR